MPIGIFKGGAGADPFTKNGFHLEWIIGDSKTGTKPTAGRTLAVGIAEEFDRPSGLFTSITSGDVKYKSTNGSPWPEYLYNLNLLTGEKARIIFSGQGGSQLYEAVTPGLSWRNDGIGTLWPLHSSYATTAMATHGVTRIKRVHIILSINDMNDGARATVDINNDWIDLINRVIALCNPLEIWISLTGQITQPNPKRVANLLFIKNNLPAAFPGVVFTDINEYMLFKSGGNADGIHLNDAGNDKYGLKRAMSVADKKAGQLDNDYLGILNGNYWDELTNDKRTAYSIFTQAQKLSGRFSLIASLQIRAADTRMNTLTDYTRHTCGEDFGFTFVAKTKIVYDGVSNAINTWFNPTPYIGLHPITQNNFCFWVKTAESTTAAGTLATVYGQTLTALSNLQQTASSTVLASANGTSATWTGSTIIPANSWIFVTRNGTTISIIVNGVTVHSQTITGVSITNSSFHEGCRGSGLTRSEWWSGAIVCSGYAALTGFDTTAFSADMDTLLTALSN